VRKPFIKGTASVEPSEVQAVIWGAHASGVLASAFCDRELCNSSLIRVKFRFKQKFVAAECGDQVTAATAPRNSTDALSLTRHGREASASFGSDATGHRLGER
jgi:hypothetical protein